MTTKIVSKTLNTIIVILALIIASISRVDFSLIVHTLTLNGWTLLAIKAILILLLLLAFDARGHENADGKD